MFSLNFLCFDFQYTVWGILWLGWNIFVICFYLSIGILDKVSLSLCCPSFELHGCKIFVIVCNFVVIVRNLLQLTVTVVRVCTNEGVCSAGIFLPLVVAGRLAICQHPEGPATGHLGTSFAWFPCVYAQMLRRFPVLQVVTAFLSCSPPPPFKLRNPLFYICVYVSNSCHQAPAHLQ